MLKNYGVAKIDYSYKSIKYSDVVMLINLLYTFLQTS